MKLTFIGTSHGVPSADRFCSCTMLESNGSVYFIDAGAPAAEMLLKSGKSVNDLRAVFTTHVHSDHTFGLFFLADLINWYFKESSADFYITEQAYIDAIKQIICISSNPAAFKFDEERVRFRLAHKGVIYKDENITVEYIPTKHAGARSYALLITEGDKRVLFSGDLSYGLSEKDMPDVIQEDIDAFICEMAHFGEKELTPYLRLCNSKRIFFNHVFPLEKYSADIESIKNKGYSFKVYAPEDGDSFEI